MIKLTVYLESVESSIIFDCQRLCIADWEEVAALTEEGGQV